MHINSLFRDRGLSDRTVKALLDCGIDMPERVLFMTPAQLAVIRGVGKTSLGEIMRYRARFVGDGAALSWLITPSVVPTRIYMRVPKGELSPNAADLAAA